MTNISAHILADSISLDGIRITTYELEFPRFILPQFNTHRLFSRNAASSRAIPVNHQIELVRENTARPIHWGKNKPGMSADEECNEYVNATVGTLLTREQAWDYVMSSSSRVAQAFVKAGYHKQIVNRLLEPFAHIKVVCTATEYDNFFWLRRHPDAQPEIQELANCMWDAMEASDPVLLNEGSWHTPYYEDGFWTPDSPDSLADAIAISSSCCAQVSYRKADTSIEKANRIYARLVESEPVHASPFEHQASPMTSDSVGITHTDVKGNMWSGNFRGWIQNRQQIEGNTCWEYSVDID